MPNVVCPGDHLLTAVCVARECGMIPSTHSVIVAETTPTSLVSFRVLGEGRSPTTESGDYHVTSQKSDW